MAKTITQAGYNRAHTLFEDAHESLASISYKCKKLIALLGDEVPGAVTDAVYGNSDFDELLAELEITVERVV